LSLHNTRWRRCRSDGARKLLPDAGSGDQKRSVVSRRSTNADARQQNNLLSRFRGLTVYSFNGSPMNNSSSSQKNQRCHFVRSNEHVANKGVGRRGVLKRSTVDQRSRADDDRRRRRGGAIIADRQSSIVLRHGIASLPSTKPHLATRFASDSRHTPPHPAATQRRS